MRTKPLSTSSLFLILVAALLTSCSGENGKPGDAPAKLNIDVTVAEAKPLKVTLESTGDIMPFEEVELRAAVGGNVLEIAFEEGEYVNKGDLLVRIDDRAWQAQISGLRARIKSAENELERKKALVKIEGASQEEVDIAEANLAELNAQLDELQVNISLANVRAPFSGVVGFRDFSLGTYLAQGAVITSLTQNDKLKVDFGIPAKYASAIKTGDEVMVVSGDDSASAVIYALDPSISSSTRTLGIRAKMDNAAKGFSAGNFAHVHVALSVDSNAIMLPTDAIVPELNAQNVFVLKNGVAKKQVVQLGTRSANEVQVLSGVEAGDTVITSGLLMVKDGMNVGSKTGQSN